MNSTDVHDLIAAVCGGDEDAYHSLIEADHTVVPALIEQFAKMDDDQCRARIVEVIWQHRIPTTVPFLASVLSDDYSEVWKQALDGLVTIGGQQSREILHAALHSMAPGDNRSPWIAEAIGQIETQKMSSEISTGRGGHFESRCRQEAG